MIGFSMLICIGQMVFSIGVTYRHFIVMVLGRFLFGLGGEILEISQATVTTKWFQNYGLAAALGLNLTFSRLATALNDNLSPFLADKFGSVPVAVWTGCFSAFISFGATIVLLFVNTPKNRQLASVDNAYQPLVENHVSMSASLSATDLFERIDSNHITEGAAEQIEDDAASEDYDEEDERIHLSQVFKFEARFWLLFFTTIFIYGSVVPFFHVCTDFFEKKWYRGDSQMAGRVMSVPDFISAVGSPLCGIIVDRLGHRSTLLPLSGILILINHALLSYTTISPFVAMSILGVAYSMFASVLWPCVPFVVGRHQIATAYGLMTVALNISLFSFPLIVAKIRENYSEDDFSGMQVFFMGMCALSILSSSLLLVLDYKKGSQLMLPSFDVNEREFTDESLRANGNLAASSDDEEESNRVQNAVERRQSYDSQTSSISQLSTAIVVGDGLVISAPVTIIHHHHSQEHMRKYAASHQELDARVSPESTMYTRRRSIQPLIETRHHHTTFCKCYNNHVSTKR